MAKGKKTGGRDFKPGVVTNPSGRPRLPDDIKAARNLTQAEFIRITNEFLCLTKEQIQERVMDKKTNTLELMIAGIVSKAVLHGDQNRLNFLLDRLVGKVPLPIARTVDPQILDKLKELESKSEEELLALVKKL